MVRVVYAYMPLDYKPRSYQKALTDFLLDGAEAMPLVRMGYGKTAATLDYMAQVIRGDRQKGHIRRFLVLAPRKVARLTWPAEIQKWGQFKDLKYGVATGSVPAPKRKRLVMNPSLDIVLMNYENLTWLCNNFPPGTFPFYGLVMDEASKLSDPGSQRFDKFRYRAHEFEVRIAMSGNLGAEGLQKLFGPTYMITSYPWKDGQLAKRMPMKAALGSSYTNFKDTYFTKDFTGYKLTPRPGATRAISRIIRPYVFQVQESDEIELPPLIVNDIFFELPKDARKQYEQLEKDFVLELERAPDVSLVDDDEEPETTEVYAANAAVLRNKLRQLCSGFLYSYTPTKYNGGLKMNRLTNWIHDAKLKAYRDAVGELMGESHLIIYGYQAEVEALNLQHTLSSKLTDAQEDALIAQWDAGKLPYLGMHPASAAHGLNLHEGGCHHAIFYTLPWSQDQFDQACCRLHRSGQTKTVVLHRLLAVNTVEQDVVKALESKQHFQQALIKALRERVG
jgi:SNF2 family DNA or RNA helicase